MMTVHEVSQITGVSVRALHYYDRIGLLHPKETTGAGYRLYGEAELERLQQILLFRELQFPLKEIREILESPDFDRDRALQQQIKLLTLKKEHLEHLIHFAEHLRRTGERDMNFQAFDTTKLDEYAAQAKETWGKTEAYREYEEKSKNWKKGDEVKMAEEFMAIFAQFGTMRGLDPADAKVQSQVCTLQEYITEHYYTCTKEILSSLGEMYAAGDSMTENIDAAGGAGTGEFVRDAIRVYCQ